MRAVPVVLCAGLLAGCNNEPVFPAYAPDACAATLKHELPNEQAKDPKTFAMLGGICIMVEQQTREYLNQNWASIPADKRRQCVAKIKDKHPDFWKGAATYIALRSCIEGKA